MPNSILLIQKRKMHQKQRQSNEASGSTRRHIYHLFQPHMFAGCPRLSVMWRCSWRGEVGDAEGDNAQRRALFPPGEAWVPLSLSPAWSFIIYRRDKIKQTQQNGVKSEGLRLSHSHTLIHGAGSWRCTEFVQVLVPASQHPSASRSQVETLC